MSFIFDAITKWLHDLLVGSIEGSLSSMFGDVNDKVGTIASQVGQTPQAWNSGIFSMIHTLSTTVVLPIAGIIITYVLCTELIGMITEKNTMHDIDTWMFFKYFFKAWVAIFLVAHTFDITMAIFDVGQWVVSQSASIIHGSTAINIDATIASMDATLQAMQVPELLLLTVETMLVSLCMKIMGVIITVILYGRMIEIYLTCSVAPVPMATMMNKEWGQMGNNYLRGLLALAFQGFFLMVCVGIYAVLVNEMIVASSIETALFSVAAYTVLLCFAMMKTGSLAKSIFNAH